MLKRTGNCFSKVFFFVLLIIFSLSSFAQDNSPYSRYGLGDLAPGTNITTRGMGGISAGYADMLSINFNNPASYSAFQTFIEQRSKKVSSGRVILDVGMNFDNRTLIEPNTPQRFTSADAYFSYVQVGLPIKKNWGLSFGLRPISRISYNISHSERLYDPNTGNPIDSANTQYTGSGGSYLPTIGTGFAIGNVSLGANVGYLFGRKETTTLRNLINDTVSYEASDYTTSTSYGSIFFNVGAQYKIFLSSDKLSSLQLGVSGNWQQKLHASQDVLRQTYTKGSAGDIIQIDSVYSQTGAEGTIVFPSSYKAGFVIQHMKKDNSGWMLGADYTQTKWSDYRFYGQKDSVQDNWQLNVGGQVFPRPGTGFLTRSVYRLGFFIGPDYIRVGNNTPQFGATFGMGIPIVNYNRLSPGQYSIINVALEYIKRGNNNNLMKENLFRISVGFNFTDLWFGKRKYE